MVPKVAISAVSLIVLLCTYGWDHYRLLLAMQKGQSKHRFAWISAILEWDINTTDSTSIFPEPLNSLKTGGKCCMYRYERLEPKMCPDCMKPAGSRERSVLILNVFWAYENSSQKCKNMTSALQWRREEGEEEINWLVLLLCCLGMHKICECLAVPLTVSDRISLFLWA